MDLESKIQLIKQVGEEIITEQELRELLETKQYPIAYDGFEPSGQMHIAQGLLRTINVNKMIKAGVHFKILVADWFAWMNNKFGGDLEKITGRGLCARRSHERQKGDAEADRAQQTIHTFPPKPLLLKNSLSWSAKTA